MDKKTTHPQEPQNFLEPRVVRIWSNQNPHSLLAEAEVAMTPDICLPILIQDELIHNLWSSKSSPGYRPNRNMYVCPLKGPYKNVQSSMACGSHKQPTHPSRIIVGKYTTMQMNNLKWNMVIWVALMMLSVGCQTKKRICSTILFIEITNTQNESRRQESGYPWGGAGRRQERGFWAVISFS